MTNSDIKKFIDYFHNTVKTVRNEKAIFVRGKDGILVSRALTIFSRPQLEMLALWFLEHKRSMTPTIGAMLSNAVLDELETTIKDPKFWKELDVLCEKYYPQAQQIHQKNKIANSFVNKDLMALKNKLFSI